MNVQAVLFWSVLLMADVVAQIEPIYDAELKENGALLIAPTELRVTDMPTPIKKWRTLLKWNLGAIPSNATITKVELVAYVTTAYGAMLVDLHQLGQNNDENVENYTDADDWLYLSTWSKYVEDSTFLQSTGSATIDLGAGAVSDAQYRLNYTGQNWFNCILICDLSMTAGPSVDARIAGTSHATQAPASLRVTYTPVAEFRVPRTGGRQPRYTSIGQNAKRIGIW